MFPLYVPAWLTHSHISLALVVTGTSHPDNPWVNWVLIGLSVLNVGLALYVRHRNQQRPDKLE